MTLNYGKYRGCDIADVPIEYLEWLLESNQETGRQVEAEIKRRQLEEENDGSMIERIIKAGYRDLTKRFHPDAGGTHEQMVELNEAYDSLMRCIR